MNSIAKPVANIFTPWLLRSLPDGSTRLPQQPKDLVDRTLVDLPVEWSIDRLIRATRAATEGAEDASGTAMSIRVRRPQFLLAASIPLTQRSYKRRIVEAGGSIHSAALSWTMLHRQPRVCH
jgi:hypothetical protein